MGLTDNEKKMKMNLEENIEKEKSNIIYYEKKVEECRFNLKVLEAYLKSEFTEGREK